LLASQYTNGRIKSKFDFYVGRCPWIKIETKSVTLATES
jgi:hypothetical protein